MAKKETKVEVVAEKVATVAEKETVAEFVVEEPKGTFAATLEPEPIISATVALAAQQAADRLARDLANFPKLG